MSSQDSMPVVYVLTGPNAGATGVWGSIPFKDGKALVSAETHRNFGHALKSYYAAFPESEIVATKDSAPAENSTPTEDPVQESSSTMKRKR